MAAPEPKTPGETGIRAPAPARHHLRWQARLDQWLAIRPDWALMGPFLIYLALLSLRDLLPANWTWLASIIRGVGGLAAVWLVRKHLPPWGRFFPIIALVAGALVAAGWVAGQHWFDGLGVPHNLPLPMFSGPVQVEDPRTVLGTGVLFWATVITRIAVACITVPLVEEIFWRGFLLRALINWEHFDRIPLGAFTWVSFLGTALLSTLEHPGNWLVSIFCWFAYNGLMYWKKSLSCLVLTHAVTNLVLYVYVVRWEDWLFW
jgi:CAAX prenyl protease-like protein